MRVFTTPKGLMVVVNILTNLAYHNHKISIFGGARLRPNIHIKDMVNAYLCLLKSTYGAYCR